MTANRIILFILLSGVYLFPQSALEEQYNFAQSLFKTEKYFDAITEFKRLSFFDNEQVYSFRSNFMIAFSYKEGGKYDDAVKYFSLSQKFAESPEDKFNSKIGVIRCNILRRSTEQAFVLLDQLEKEYSSRQEDINYWRGWAYIFAGKWDEAAKEFNNISPKHPLGKICEQTADEEYSVTFSKVMSYLLPGSGQVYTGNVLSGLMSVGWNALFAYLSISSFNEDRILDGFVYAGLFFRFHRGNVQNSEKFAINENINISNQALKILENYNGLKP